MNDDKIKVISTEDKDGNPVYDGSGVTVTFFKDGVMTQNQNSYTLGWMSDSITQINIYDKGLMIMYNRDTELLTLTHSENEKNIFFSVDELAEHVKNNGITYEELEKQAEEEQKKGDTNEE